MGVFDVVYGVGVGGVLYFVYGGEKVGKTSFALMFSANVLRGGGSVVYIDCGGRLYFPRLERVLGSYGAEADRLFITSPMDFEEQEMAVINVVSSPPKGVKAIVCDNFTYLHRLEIEGNPRADLPIYKRLAYQVALLKEACIEMKIPVIIIGQVHEIPSREQAEPVAGRIMRYWPDVVIRMSREAGKEGELVFERPSTMRFKYKITDRGIDITEKITDE